MSGKYYSDAGAGPGGETTAEDPTRAVWYGMCGYWTDDWSHFDGQVGVPTCPAGCGAPGYITTWRDWFASAEKFEDKQGNPRYVEWLLTTRHGGCGRKLGKEPMTQYEEWLEKRGDE